MTALISLDEQNVEKKLTIIRRYHTEILFIILFAAIGILFKKNSDLNDKFSEYVVTRSDENSKRVAENTETLRETNFVLRDIKIYLSTKK